MVQLAEFIVMPNHLHGILLLNHDSKASKHNVGTQNFASLRSREHYNKFGPQSMNLSSIIRGYKMTVRKYAVIHNREFFWQARFYDRVVRNQEEYEKIKEYIKNNPEHWEEDRNNPENFLKSKNIA